MKTKTVLFHRRLRRRCDVQKAHFASWTCVLDSVPIVFDFNGNLRAWWAYRLWSVRNYTPKVSISSALHWDRKWGLELQQKTLTSLSEVCGNLNIDVYANVTLVRLNLTLKQRTGKVGQWPRLNPRIMTIRPNRKQSPDTMKTPWRSNIPFDRNECLFY